MDNSVGAIVWVRRRNGSWWPGRILGPDELNTSHLMSPRSGTPVKLLGREDASVDWYNLEKSKRVKAFRCGEFDDCIARAEASLGIPMRKREKYARREDAIMHALELERLHLGKKHQKLGATSNYSSNTMSGNLKKEADCSSSIANLPKFSAAKENRKVVSVQTEMLSKRQDPSHDPDLMRDYLSSQNVAGHLNQPGWEEGDSEATPRMRGLQDFGLRTAQSQGKFSPATACESSQRLVSIGSDLYAHSSIRRNITRPNNACNLYSLLTTKKRRSQSGLIEESLVKRHDRSRPLVQVLQSSAKLPMNESPKYGIDAASISTYGDGLTGVSCRAKRSRCVYLYSELSNCLDQIEFPSEQMQVSTSPFQMNNGLHPGSLSEETTSSGLIEEQECDSSEEDGTAAATEEDVAGFLDPSHPGGSIQCVPGQSGNANDEELEESLDPHYQTSGATSDMRGSKWQWKGKRNAINLIRWSMEPLDAKDSAMAVDAYNCSVSGFPHDAKGRTVRRVQAIGRQALGQGVYHVSENFYFANEEDNLGFASRKYPFSFAASSRDQEISNNDINDPEEDSHLMPFSVWNGGRLSQASLRRGYWDNSNEFLDPLYTHHSVDWMEHMLVDVDLKVQARYRGERVPLVSLMSRLNGKAIIGHPVQVDTMEDGSSAPILSTDNSCEELPDSDGNTGPPSVWRTARRTAMYRVPRAQPSSALEETDPTQSSDLQNKPIDRKLYANHLNQDFKQMKKSSRHVHYSPKRVPKKVSKKISFSGQKTRTLSSIAVGQQERQKKEPKEAIPVVMCVPVKCVFGRILEAVGKPSSMAGNYSSRISSTEEKPS